MKKIKMKTLIITAVSVTAAVALIVICVLAATNSNSLLRNKINENMSTYLDAQANSVEEFVKNSENKLQLYSRSGVITDLILENAADTNTALPEFSDPDYNTKAYYADNYPSYNACFISTRLVLLSSTTSTHIPDSFDAASEWDA